MKLTLVLIGAIALCAGGMMSGVPKIMLASALIAVANVLLLS